MKHASTALPARAWLAAACLALAGWSAPGFAQSTVPQPLAKPASEDAPPPGPPSRGHYLAIAGDCMACHSTAQGKQFAGGYALSTPMGTIYTSNITPSKQYGIGTYTLQQFSQALREGKRADGANLYPAMPYASYAKLTDEDVAALYDYFMHEVKPVEEAAPETRLPFPFSLRPSLAVWNVLNLDKKSYTPDPARDARWNRGKYLVDGLAHCGECHTPRNASMGPDSGAYLAGGDLGAWYAPNLTSDPVSGLGSWSDQELATYLKTGRSEHARAAGPMAEAVEHSFQHLDDADIQAIVAYLRTVPAIATPGQAKAPNASTGQPPQYDVLAANARRDQHQLGNLADGGLLYASACASCHQMDGRGTHDGDYPSLVGNTTVGLANPTDLLAAIVNGVDRSVDGKQVLMPNFGEHSLVQRLDDAQTAAVANYVIDHFGHGNGQVTAADVAVVRAGGKPALIAKLADPRVQALLGGLGLLVLVAIFVLVRRRRAARARTSH